MALLQIEMLTIRCMPNGDCSHASCIVNHTHTHTHTVQSTSAVGEPYS